MTVNDVVKVCCTPVFFSSTVGFEPVMKALWDAHAKLVRSRAITPAGRLAKGCRGCNGRKIMRQYTQVYRVFARRCLELHKKNPEALAPIRQLFKVSSLILVDPDTHRPVTL